MSGAGEGQPQTPHVGFWKGHRERMITLGTTLLWVQGFTKRPLQSPQLGLTPAAFDGGCLLCRPCASTLGGSSH